MILSHEFSKNGCILILYDVLCIQVAVVVVAFPATPLLLARARVCISAAHTHDDLEQALKV